MKLRNKKEKKDIYNQIAEYIDALYELCELNGLYYFPSLGKTKTYEDTQYNKEKLVWSYPESFEIYNYLSEFSDEYKGEVIRKKEYIDFLIDLHCEQKPKKKRRKKNDK